MPKPEQKSKTSASTLNAFSVTKPNQVIQHGDKRSQTNLRKLQVGIGNTGFLHTCLNVSYTNLTTIICYITYICYLYAIK